MRILQIIREYNENYKSNKFSLKCSRYSRKIRSIRIMIYGII